VAYISAEAGNALGHLLHRRAIHFQQVHSQTQRGATTYARQFGEL
jgi:hypothetical protein